MKKLFILLIAVLFMFSTSVYSAEKQKPKQKLMDNYIAVFDVETVDVDSKLSRPLTESIRRELVMSGKYEIIDRGNMNKILGEQKFQMSGCVAGQCIVEAGQLLGAGKIIAGTVSMVGKTYYLTLSLINVETGKIENVSEDECKCEVDDLIKSSKRLVKRLLGEIVPDSMITKAEKDEKAERDKLEKEKVDREKLEKYRLEKERPERERQEILAKGGRFRVAEGIIEDLKLSLEWVPVPDRAMNHYDAEKYAQNLSLAGGSWRLPTRAELKSLYDTSKPGNADPVFGVGTNWVWTSEESSSSVAWIFDFHSGKEGFSIRGKALQRVLAVRSRQNQVTERFIMKGGVIEDSKLGLQWMPAPDKAMNHYDAEKYAQNLSLNGGGWRLPTRSELTSLYDKSKSGNADSVFGIHNKWVWTSELDGSSEAWYFNFAAGGEYRYSRDRSFSNPRVLAVRSRR